MKTVFPLALKRAVLLACVLLAAAARAQSPDSLRPAPAAPVLTIKAYAEGYYTYDPSMAQRKSRPFLYDFDRENEFGLDLGFVEVTGTADRFRFRFTPALGSFMQANYANEPEGFRYVFEGNAGIKLSAGRNIWLDAGVLPSPTGYETALSIQQNNLTRSLSAENSPYYLTGVRLTVPLTARTTAALFVVNGWQNIRETNAAKSLVWQLSRQATPSLLLNYTGYLGDESPDPDTLGRAYRFYHDFYLSYRASDRLNLVALFDIGVQNGMGLSRLWHTANLTARYALLPYLKLGARAEYFSDPGRVLLSGLPKDARVYGASLNLDYVPDPRVALRLESRYLASLQENYLDRHGRPAKGFLLNTAAITAYF